MRKIWIFFFTIFAISQAMCGPLNWSTPVTLSVTATDATDPQIVIDNNGNATAAWVENGVVNTSSQPVGGSWGSVTTLSSSGASNPRLIVDASGNVTAAWLEGDTTVRSKTLLFGSSWGSTNQLSDKGATSLSFAVDSTTGNIVAVWERSGFIESATRLFGLPWGQVSVISDAGSDSPQVAVNNGTAVAVWHMPPSAAIGFIEAVFAATLNVGGFWSQAQGISPQNLSHAYPAVAVDAKGNIQAVWYQFSLSGLSYSNVAVVGSSLLAGSTNWSTPVVISALGNYNPAALTVRVAFDANGDAIASWSNVYIENLFNVEVAILPASGTWGGTEGLALNNLYSYVGDIAVNSYGDAVLVYMTYDGVSSVNIQNTESNIAGVRSGFWSVPITISQGTQNADPRVASMLNGTTINAAAVWINNNGTNNIIQASTGSRTILLPPSSPIVVQSVNNWGVFNEYYNTLSWTASTDPNTVSYNIYRNGALYRQVDVSTLLIVDDNQVQNGPVVYGVASIDGNEAQSQIIYVSYP